MANPQVVDARARQISHNVRCLECGNQNIEDSQADVAILLRKLIRDEIRTGKSDEQIYKKLQDDFGETVLYDPKFDMQTAAMWIMPFLVTGIGVGVWAYKRHKRNTNVEVMTSNIVKGITFSQKEKETMLKLLTPPPPQVTNTSWLRRWRGQ